MTSNAAPPRVWSLGIGLGGGVVKGSAVNRLQPQHVDPTDLRWLDWIFQKSYCSSLKINYDATSNVMVKQLPQLYYKKMKVCCDWCYVDIGVSIAR